MEKLVCESLDEFLAEGRFSRALGTAALGATLAFGTPQEAGTSKPAYRTEISDFDIEELDFDSVIEIFFDTGSQLKELAKSPDILPEDKKKIAGFLTQFAILASQVEPHKIIPMKSTDRNQDLFRTGRRGGSRPMKKGKKGMDKLVKMLKAWIQSVKNAILKKYFKS